MDNIYGFSTKESSQKMLLVEGFNSDAGIGISDDRSSNYNKPYKSPLKTKGDRPSLCSAWFWRMLRSPS
ncbi:hypothetical protein [Microcoleus asticus]|uniref:Uncharacterized protein n=1 Tax=Microcoleus asticus IPMA8 TaxID=2563858 RepID=A0ABX2CUJ9_9CYAN|nr:hypothetical protein [Microcoleus asticus]NQE34079.1 hypothetical protein [Microcoleus asticus IPMA8]